MSETYDLYRATMSIAKAIGESMFDRFGHGC